MDFKRGVIRLWLVCSAFWIAAIALIESTTAHYMWLDCQPVASLPVTRLWTDCEVGLGTELNISNLAQAFMIAIGPPLLVAASFMLVVWVLHGFVPAQTRSGDEP